MPGPTLDMFARAQGDTFEAVVGDMVVPMTLTSAEELPRGGHRADAPFQLEFEGPTAAQLPQAAYLFRHPGLGAHEIFIVPVAGTPSTITYQATFN